MNNREIEIIRFILAQKKTHYAEIAQYMQLSKRTIATYLDQLALDVQQYDVELVRKPNDGIYLTGELSSLIATLQQVDTSLPQTKDERSYYILSKLLLNSDAYTIQQFSEELFVSRTTIESDLKQVKQLLQPFQLDLKTTHGGLSLIGQEDRRRHATAELISHYWGKSSKLKQQNGQFIRNVQLPEKMSQLFSSEVVESVMAALTEFVESSALEFTDYEFQSLAIHLMIAFERMAQNRLTADTNLQGIPLISETKQLVDILERRFQRQIPKFEQNYINLHLVAVTNRGISSRMLKSSMKSASTLSEFLQDELADIHPDSELIKGLTVHLQSAIRRLKVGLNIYNPYADEIRMNFPQAFDDAVLLKQGIEKQYAVSLNTDELAFISLHFESFIERNVTNRRLSVVVVCGSGMGTSQLLAQRINREFSELIQITRVISVGELIAKPLTEDLVVSTIGITDIKKPVIEVSPLLNATDSRMIQHFIDKHLQSDPKSNYFAELLNPQMIIHVNMPMDYQKVIQTIGEQLTSQGFAKDDVISAAIQREQLATTAMRDVALPHADPNFIKIPVIAILVNPAGIEWVNGEKVKVVFFMALNQSVQSRLRSIYRIFDQMVDNKRFIKKITQTKSSDELVALIKSITETK